MAIARDVMTPATGCLDESDSIATAAVRMRDLDVSSIPVCDHSGRLAGVITYRDIVVRCLAVGSDPSSMSTLELVDDDTLAVAADEPVESALLTMAIHHVRRAPVVDHGQLVGMLADSDLAQSLPDDALGVLFGRRTASPRVRTRMATAAAGCSRPLRRGRGA
jgi:CBS domain-containing protein